MIILWQCAFEKDDHNCVNGDIGCIKSSCTWAVYVNCGNEKKIEIIGVVTLVMFQTLVRNQTLAWNQTLV